MTDKLLLTNTQIMLRASNICAKITWSQITSSTNDISVFAVPRGGIAAAYALERYLPAPYRFNYVEDPKDADLFIDDLIDSGATIRRYLEISPKAGFIALYDKRDPISISHGKWVVFPWEEAEDVGIEDNIRRILQCVGEDPAREGLEETPSRVAEAWRSWTAGYGQHPKDILKTFKDGSDSYDEMVVVKDIPFYSHCEHHMAPFFGTATIGYIPDGKIVGLSKLSRLLDIYARRLQVQERLTSQVAKALQENLNPLGCGVVIKARHLCMESRGICQQGHHTITSALTGALKTDASARSEFLSLIK